MSIRDLPVELLLAIARYTPKESLHSLALLSKFMHSAANSVLYNTIVLVDPESAVRCTETLSHSDELARFVRSFKLSDMGLHIISYQDTADLMEYMPKSIERMVHLQRFAIESYGFSTPDVFAALSMHVTPTLKALTFLVEHDILDDSISKLENLRPDFKVLTELDIRVRDDQEYPALYVAWMKHIFRSRAGRLRVLNLDCGSGHRIREFLSTTQGLPCVEELAISISCLDLPCLACTPRVTKLTIGGLKPKIPLPAIPEAGFPAVTHTLCFCDVLSSILTAAPNRPKPVTTVCLGLFHVKGIVVPAQYMQRLRGPSWEDTLQAIKSLPNSSGPVTDLSFYVHQMDFRDLTDVVPYIMHLQSLSVYFNWFHRDVRYLYNLGETFFARLPKLQTFVLSGGSWSIPYDESFLFFVSGCQGGILELLRQWGIHSTTLRYVAFTSTFVFMKSGGAWVKIYNSVGHEDEEGRMIMRIRAMDGMLYGSG